jgi:predicted heme/steroid binding protein
MPHSFSKTPHMTVSYFTESQVAAHNSESDCWIIVHGKVYNVTSFLADHPGGKKVILKHAGTDATKQFDAFHNLATLDKYGPALYIGDVGKPPSAVSGGSSTSAADVDGSDLEPFGELVPFGDPSWYQDGIPSPYYKDSHRRLRAKMREFVEREIAPYVHEWDGTNTNACIDVHRGQTGPTQLLYKVRRAQHLGRIARYLATQVHEEAECV